MASNSDGECYSRIHGMHWRNQKSHRDNIVLKGTQQQMKSKESVEYSYKCKGGSVPISLDVMSTWSYLSGRITLPVSQRIYTLSIN